MNKDSRTFLQQNGYVVLESYLSNDLVAAAQEYITKSISVDLRDPSTWRSQQIDPHGSVPLFNSQALWDLRQNPGLYELHKELYGQKNRLVTSIGRCSFKRPHNDIPVHGLPSFPFHWDCDPLIFEGASYQCVIYLTDVKRNGGEFSCIPSIYKDYKNWIKKNDTLILDFGARGINSESVPYQDIVKIRASAGTVIVFNRMMPHTGLVNTGISPRIAFLLEYFVIKDNSDYMELRNLYEIGLPPKWARSRWPSIIDYPIENYTKPVLNKVGNKITGEKFNE